MPRIRNWKDLNFYRPAASARYRHIDDLSGQPGRNVIDWDLIESHYDDLMRVALSIQAGKISSVTLLRRLSTYSRPNNFCKAFREVGRVIRTVQLLRFLSDPQLRARTAAASSKAESCNNFAAWCRFGNGGVSADNDPGEQEKIVKFSALPTNCVVFHTTVDMMAVLRDLTARGWTITAVDLAVLSPYLTARIQRFGVYATGEITLTRRLRRPPGRRAEPAGTGPPRTPHRRVSREGDHARTRLSTLQHPAGGQVGLQHPANSCRP